MNARQLKSSILQYAMQGKLVDQDLAEESVSVLLEKLVKDKELLTKKKLKEGESHFSYINEEEIPFEIPDSWKWVRVKELCEINPKNRAADDIEAGFIPMKLIEDGFSNQHSYEKKTWGEIKKGYTHFQSGDIVVAKITPCFENLKSAIIRELPNNIGAGTTELFVFRPYSNLINKKYLLWIFKTSLFIEKGVSSFSGTAGQQRASRNFIENYLVPLPPYEEQKRIVDKINVLEEKVDTYGALYQRNEFIQKKFPFDLERSILQYAMKGKLVSQDTSDKSTSILLEKIRTEKEKIEKHKRSKKKEFIQITKEEVPFDIPTSWEWVRLKELGFIISGGTPKTAISDYWSDEGLLWITPSDMGKAKDKYIAASSRKISEKGLDSSSAQLIPGNSIVYSSRAPIGHINIVEEQYATNQGCKSIHPLKDYVDIDFLYYALKFMTPWIQRKATGTTFKEISGTVFGESVIPFPPLEEQRRIVKKIEELIRVTNILRIKN
ncbi:restriction endonuclease subunit S [Planomicrobium sp. MB-3u-38]|uniref:restriction endonuclease subunit S n=1 Tax=Planomicrobium sp. MB-3u-38 TaxID=2058318 RepID=UPI000C7CD869|nr:restriction endonuclease subunit S [Planomicrobium sp. MB-3u-38]PKH11724.1 hypothetical protein CXF70_03255 [Planomicrobium sp. MB-3u-38]